MVPRIAVLGCGHWGGNHIRTLQSLRALAAVSDVDSDRAASFQVFMALMLWRLMIFLLVEILMRWY